jgi:hypothetical protein
LNGGRLSYESGLAINPDWIWRLPYGFDWKDQWSSVHLMQKEAESICGFYRKRLPSHLEWVGAAFIGQRTTAPASFKKRALSIFWQLRTLPHHIVLVVDITIKV